MAEVRDASLSLKHRMDSELTLEKAINAVRQRETIKKQQTILRGQQSSKSRHSVNWRLKASHSPKVGQ